LSAIPLLAVRAALTEICPTALVTRGLAAYMIVKAKDLTMP
jgi:hypothetical protein